MSTIKVGDAQIEYSLRGTGNTELLLVPGGLVAAAFQPLASELARRFSDRLRTVELHRRGYGGSTRPIPPFGLEDQARDCLAVMDGLGIDRAHVVGHSIGGLIAVQMAAAAPDRVRSLTLIEPALTGFIPSAARAAQALGRVAALHQSGNSSEALDTFLRGVSGEGYRAVMDRALPAGWFEEATESMGVLLEVELPSIRAWRLDAPGRVRQPVLSVYGTEKRWGGTDAFGVEFDRVVCSWFPQAKSLPLQGSYHWPHVTDPAGLGSELARFVEAA